MAKSDSSRSQLTQVSQGQSETALAQPMPGAPGVELKSFQLAHAIRAICYEIATIRAALGGSAELDPSVDAPLFQLDQSGNASIDAIALRKAADALAEALSSLGPTLTAAIDNIYATVRMMIEPRLRAAMQPQITNAEIIGIARAFARPLSVADLGNGQDILASQIFGA